MARAAAIVSTQNPKMAALLRDLQQHPVNVARAHTLPKKRRGLSNGSAVTPTQDFYMPQTGIAPIDEAGQKVYAVSKFGLDALIDIPKSAFKGSVYGAICGTLASLLFYRAELLKLFRGKLPMQMGIFTAALIGAGSLLGGGIAGFQAIRRNLREGMQLIGLK